MPLLRWRRESSGPYWGSKDKFALSDARILHHPLRRKSVKSRFRDQAAGRFRQQSRADVLEKLFAAKFGHLRKQSSFTKLLFTLYRPKLFSVERPDKLKASRMRNLVALLTTVGLFIMK
jgi:hypothetical protein